MLLIKVIKLVIDGFNLIILININILILTELKKVKKQSLPLN